MTDTSSTANTAMRTVTAFFDTTEHATTAKADLITAGVSANDITIVGSDAEQFTVESDRPHGFWHALSNWFLPDDERRTYAEGLRRGGFALSVKTDDHLYSRVIDVLDRDGAVDLDEREMSWRDEGWSNDKSLLGPSALDAAYLPAGAGTAGFGASLAGDDGLGAVGEPLNPDVRERINAGTASQTAPAPTGGPHTYMTAASPEDDHIADAATGRVDADNLFGRRDLDHGRTRVRSYIVEGDVNR